MAAPPQRLIVAALVGIALLSARAQPAERIISLVPALTEMLFAIGAGPQVIAVSSYDDYPPEVKSLPKVGALLDPDTERILSMRPTLVLIYGSQDDLRAQLQRTGIAVFDYRHGGLAHVTATIRRLGEATGLTEEARGVADGIEARLEATRRRVAGRPRPRTMLVFSREALSLRNVFVSGGRGFLHDILEAAGGTNVFADVDREGVRASTEMMLTRRPDVIVELHNGDPPPGDGVQREREVWAVLSAIPAVKTRRTHLLYGDHLLVPGPRVAQAADEIARVLHP